MVLSSCAHPHHSPVSGHVKKLVVLLHGYGSSGDDLISLAPYWAQDLDDTLFLSPHGFTAFSDDSFQRGYQWFGLPDLSPSTIETGVAEAVPSLHTLLDEWLDQYGLQDKDLALVGFSQGAMMALATGLSRPRACAGVVAYSGIFVTPQALALETPCPVLLIHGDQDQVVPVSYHTLAQKELSRRGVPMTSLVCQNTGHGIDEKGVKTGGDFLRQHLSK